MTSAEVEGTMRAFHDLRHTSLTRDAASGSSAIAVMTKAGHANMARPGATCTSPAPCSGPMPSGLRSGYSAVKG
jgi:hypothetical protein